MYGNAPMQPMWVEKMTTVTFTFYYFRQGCCHGQSGRKQTGMGDEYKKVYPKDDVANLNIKLNDLRDVVSQELWELVDITD
ncbi:MAG: hypothetical protein IPG18_15400 [Saprospiraceae bacterium]|nr:hypothetical protein [Saprospiraceae bacterium]